MRPRACERLTCPRSPAAEATGYHCKAPLGLVRRFPSIVTPSPALPPPRSCVFARRGGSHSRAALRGQSPAPPTVRPQPKRGEAGRGAMAPAAQPVSGPVVSGKSPAPPAKKTRPGESVTRRVTRARPPSCARVRVSASRVHLRPRLKPRATVAKPRWGWSGVFRPSLPPPRPSPPAHAYSLAGEGAIRVQRFVVTRQLLPP